MTAALQKVPHLAPINPRERDRGRPADAQNAWAAQARDPAASLVPVTILRWDGEPQHYFLTRAAYLRCLRWPKAPAADETLAAFIRRNAVSPHAAVGDVALNDAALEAVGWPADAAPPIPADAPAPPVDWRDRDAEREADERGVTGVAALIFAALTVAYFGLRILGVIPTPSF